MLVVTLHNTSDLADVSDYHFEVWVTTATGKKRLVEVGDVVGHVRADGWKALVQRVLDETSTS
jgi:hypothetical protein